MLFCRFKIKESLDFTKIEEDPEAKHWRKTIEPLVQSTRLARSFWGKIKENPCHAIFIAEWWDHQDFLNFKSSPGFETLVSGLSTIEEPSVYELEPFRKVGRHRNWPHEGVSINTVYFPAPVTDEVRNHIYGLRGMESGASMGGIRGSAHPWYKNIPDGAWKIGTEERSGIWMNTFIYFHYWRSPKEEREFKENTLIGRMAVKNWEENLEYAGAVEITEEHCDLTDMRQIRLIKE